MEDANNTDDLGGSVLRCEIMASTMVVCSNSRYRGYRRIRSVCGREEGVAVYDVVGALGKVRMAICGAHAARARKWRRRSIQKVS